MKRLNRRRFVGLGTAAAAGTAAPLGAMTAEERHPLSPDYVGVLVDTTLCIGCRKCEEACNRRNHLPRTAESFSDREVSARASGARPRTPSRWSTSSPAAPPRTRPRCR